MTKSVAHLLITSVLTSTIVAFSGHSYISQPRRISPKAPAASNDNDFEGFNPFQPGSKIKSTTGGITVGSAPSNQTPGGQLSARSMKMSSLIESLLAASPEERRDILLSHEEFLLQQFDPEAALDAESIFTPEMNRGERFEVYRREMERRMGLAKRGEVRSVLAGMMEFVLERE